MIHALRSEMSLSEISLKFVNFPMREKQFFWQFVVLHEFDEVDDELLAVEVVVLEQFVAARSHVWRDENRHENEPRRVAEHGELLVRNLTLDVLLNRRVRLKRKSAADHREERDARRPDVSAHVVETVSHQFGRLVVGRADARFAELVG